MKKKNSAILFGLLFLVGFGILVYPTVSNQWNTYRQSQLISNYQSVVQDMTPEDFTQEWERAEAFNATITQNNLYSDVFGESTTDLQSTEYWKILNEAGDGIMGYLSIPKINIKLAIYHGTADDVLQTGVGHLNGTKLPIGGESTHCVVAAHRGLPSAKLFTDIDQLRNGDKFYIHVLDQVLAYEVDQILIVEPAQLESLNIVDGEDYCTLLTCTPYGINTHRLLVRGHRIENEQGSIVIQREAIKIPAYIAAPAIAIPILFILLLVLMFTYRRKPKRVDTSDVRNMSRPKKPEKTDSEKDKK